MMIGVRNHHQNPTVHIPPWTLFDDPTAEASFPFPLSGISVNHSKNTDDYSPLDSLTANDFDLGSDESGLELDLPLDLYSSDHFRMFEFKIRKCTRARSHDWTECPFSHPGEKARRRDPRRHNYSGTGCPDFRKGSCKKGDACEYAHGVFECWLHPSRYRTQPCKDGAHCRRRVCFFAHSPDQLRVLSPASDSGYDGSPHRLGLESGYDGSPHRLALEGLSAKGLCFVSSPESVSSPAADSPPMVDSLSRSLGSNSVSEVVASLRRLQLNKVKSMPSSYGHQVGFGSPRVSLAQPVFSSLPSTPTGAMTREGTGSFEEPVMERVESGRGLRARMFEKLSRENPLDRVDPEPALSGPNVGWVSELVK